MRRVKLVSLVIIVAVLAYAIVEREYIRHFFYAEEEHECIDKNNHNISDDENGGLSFYQGEVVSVEHGAGYTYIEIKEKTNITFWIAVERAEVNHGDYVLFQEELVAKDFYSKALDRTFKEIMFASNLHYRVSER